MAVLLVDQAPSTELFIELRTQCGWGTISKDVANIAITNSFLWVSAKSSDDIVGFVRLIGDGALNYYVQDLIVSDAFRGQGIGKLLMSELMSSCIGVVPDGATIGLMSVHGKEEFYKEFGFQIRPSGRFGSGMTMSFRALTS